MERLAGNEVLRDLPFELDAVGAVLRHGFHPLKARQPRSIPNPQSVRRQGRIPVCCLNQCCALTPAQNLCRTIFVVTATAKLRIRSVAQ